jgi:hypothetical protein
MLGKALALSAALLGAGMKSWHPKQQARPLTAARPHGHGDAAKKMRPHPITIKKLKV